MAAGVENFSVEQGAYWSQELLWKDSEDQPVNLTGWTARMQVRRAISSPDPIIELTTENGRITLGGIDGTILLELTSDDTADLPAAFAKQKWVYDLELVPNEEHVVRLLKGKFLVSPEVTRPVST